MSRTFLAVDFLNLAFRAVYGYPPLTAPDGTPIGGTMGVLAMTQSLAACCDATHIAFAFESTTGTHRADAFGGYKAGRPDLDPGFRAQLHLANVAVGKMGWARYRTERYEADDALVVLTRAAIADGFEHAYIATGDRDLMGGVADDVTLLWTAQGMGKLTDRAHTNWYTPAKVEERYGVRPDQIADRKALCGDTSDAIPGVPGIGEVKAAPLIRLFGSFEALYGALAAVRDGVADAETAALVASIAPGVMRRLVAGEASGRLSHMLGSLVADAALTPAFDPEAGRLGHDDRERTLTFLRAYGLASVERRLPRSTA